MSGNWRAGFGQLAIALFLGGVTVPCWETIASAQIIPDETLGDESSVVTPDNIKGIESDRISGGAKRGSNLFHSFREFNIGEGRGGYFESRAAIENIFSRVTGSNLSNILGTLGVLGDANLFFLNPNGIIFGENASLDLNGSFLATTADSIVFPDGKQFSGTNPEAPPLLTVNVQQPIGLEFQGRQGVISNLGNLDVDAGQNLALVGGDVTLDGSSLIAPGGRIELGGLSAAGEIDINADGSLSFPDALARADVLLSNLAKVEVTGERRGSIAINARNLELLESALVAGIGSGLGATGAQAGNIELNATERISLDRSFVANDLQQGAIGKGGNIKIFTNQLFVTNGTTVAASNFGHGDAGSVIINAKDTVSLDGASNVFSTVERNGNGNSGNIDITTNSISVTNGAQISASTLEQGNAGSVIIDAKNNIFVDGEDSNGFRSGIFSQVRENAIGKGGSIGITTASLAVTNGAQLVANTRGEGDAGSININATDTVSFAGTSRNGRSSKATSRVVETGVGKGGSIEIITGSLSVTNGAKLEAGTLGRGDAGSININATDTISFDGGDALSGVFNDAIGKGGNIEITTRSLFVTNDSRLVAGTNGQGDAGNVIINAKNTVSFDKAGVLSSVDEKGKGNGGSIKITTDSVSIINGAQLSASTFGKGNAGNVIIDANDSVSFDGDMSVAFTSVEEKGEGNGGNIEITTDSLSVTNSAQLIAFTKGEGDAGNVIINAKDTVSLDGVSQKSPTFRSAAFSQVRENAIGKGGNIEISTDSLVVTNGAQLQASTDGNGNAGNVIINAKDSVSLDGVSNNGQSFSRAFSEVRENATGKGGSIVITTDSLSVTNGAQLSVSTLGEGKAGSITITANTLKANTEGQLRTITSSSSDAGDITLAVAESITLAGTDSGLFANTGAESTGKGGNIFIDPNTVIIRDGAQIAVNSDGSGVGGNIDLQAGSLTLDRGTITAKTASNQGGDINLTLSDLLTLRDNSQITASAGTTGIDEAEGNGGNIKIDTPFIISSPFENNDITANASFGNGGEIEINSQGIFGIELRDGETDLSDITVSSQFGQPGEVEINTSAIDPTRGLNNLPQEAVEAEVAQGCQTVGGKPTLEFFDIGRGGLPPTPEDLFSSEVVIAEWIPLDFADEKKQEPTSEKSFTEEEIQNMTLLTNLSCRRN